MRQRRDNAFEVEFQQYMHETEPRTQKYSEMLDANTKTTEAIYGMSVDINRTKKKTQKLALKAAQIKRENDDRNEALRREKDIIIRHYHDLKKKMAKLRSQKEEHLGTLVTNSLHCMEKLRSYQSLGERILKTAELCRKLETEKEKVLPFYQSDPDAQEESDQMVEKIQGVDPHSYNEFKQLDNFYKRYNKVNLDKLAIQKQKATLEKENLFFKNLLKQYLDGVSVNDDVINNNNPLLVVNNRVNLNRPPVVMEDGAATTYIEGNTVVNNLARQHENNYH
eukprot:Macronucleus_1450.p1 GENE.Macronucleus_1450~~Macronucleus_1450.p1  ORF type:complete len:280 (+),score=135.42 Macronucleus_1450:1-840(+)